MTAPVLLGYFTPGSDEWHAARANGLGGSEIGAVLGLSPYDSMFSLYHRKKGMLADKAVNAQMSWGTRLEPVIAAKFLEDHPEYIPCGSSTYRHADRPWQIANPDLLLEPDHDCHLVCEGDVLPPALLEVKTAMFADEWGPAGSDVIPARYRCQVLWYLDVMGLDLGYVAVLISGSDYREYTIRPEPGEIEYIRDAGAAFMLRLNDDSRPDIDSHSQTFTAIREMHPEISGNDVELDRPLAYDYCAARRDLDAAKAEEYRTKSLVSDALGDGRRATYLGKTIATRQAKAGGTPYLVAARILPTFEQEITA